MYFIESVIEGVDTTEVNSQIDFACTRYEDIIEEIKDLQIEGDYVTLYELDDTFVCDVLSDFVKYGQTDFQFDDFETSILAEFAYDITKERYIDLRNGTEYI